MPLHGRQFADDLRFVARQLLAQRREYCRQLRIFGLCGQFLCPVQG